METLPEYTQRALTITLRKDNIEQLEKMSCEEIVSHVEELDDAYYRAIPLSMTLPDSMGTRKTEGCTVSRSL